MYFSSFCFGLSPFCSFHLPNPVFYYQLSSSSLASTIVSSTISNFSVLLSVFFFIFYASFFILASKLVSSSLLTISKYFSSFCFESFCSSFHPFLSSQLPSTNTLLTLLPVVFFNFQFIFRLSVSTFPHFAPFIFLFQCCFYYSL